MSKRKEKISAFLDNDMHRDELMSFSLSGEVEDAKVVQRYQIIGDAMRGELSESSFIDVSHTVRDALSGENIADATLVKDTDVAPGQSASKPSSAWPSSAWRLSGWLRPVAGMAVAASVAIVMVVSVTGQDQTGTMPVAANIPEHISAQPVLQLAIDNKAPDDGALSNTASVNPQLDQYLMNQHLEFATQDTLQGRLPYVRAVSFAPEK